MKADPMNAFGRVRIAQDKSRNDGSKSNHEPGAFQEFYPFCDPRESSTATIFDDQHGVNGDW
jgi:hypothetical protein